MQSTIFLKKDSSAYIQKIQCDGPCPCITTTKSTTTTEIEWTNVYNFTGTMASTKPTTSTTTSIKMERSDESDSSGYDSDMATQYVEYSGEIYEDDINTKLLKQTEFLAQLN